MIKEKMKRLAMLLAVAMLALGGGAALSLATSTIAPEKAWAQDYGYLSWNGGHYNYDHDGDGSMDMDDPWFTVTINGQEMTGECADNFGCTPADGWYPVDWWLAEETADHKIWNGIVYTSCVALENTPVCLTSVSCYARAVYVKED